jgi:protein-arginine kinase activator protein McsA
MDCEKCKDPRNMIWAVPAINETADDESVEVCYQCAACGREYYALVRLASFIPVD